jgi:hypothetical protein
MTTVCIHQPDFLPYLGFFDRLLDVDQFILLDDVQVLRRGWHHRDKIKAKSGQGVWLTQSVEKCARDTPINQVKLSVDNPAWVEDNLNLLRENYLGAPFFEQMMIGVENIYAMAHRRLIDSNLAFLEWALRFFDLRPKMILASSFSVTTTSSQRLIDLVRAVGGTKYLSGTGALGYLDIDLFRGQGIEVIVQDFKHPVYPQLHGDFVPFLSCLDLFFNCGDESARVLRSCRA